jgi:peptide deformylase
MNIVSPPLKIVLYPHPALRHKARPLTAIDRRVQYYAAAMLDLMYEHNGLGLAGTQVGLPYQIVVMNYVADRQQPDKEGVYLNPVILEKKGGRVEGEEGCLSFPGLYQKVRRAKTVVAQAYNLKGELLEVEVSDLPARLWQHEVDHLHGELFIDKMGPVALLASRGTLKEFERDYRKAQERGEIPPEVEIHRRLRELEQQPDGAEPPPIL